MKGVPFLVTLAEPMRELGMRYESHRLFDFPIGNDTAHGIWDHRNQAFIRLDNKTWNVWDAGKAEAAAARLNAGKGLEDD